MPTYEYACRACGRSLEVVQSFSDDPLTTCEDCGGELRKVFSAAGLIFKGSGWHIKDYAGSGRASGGTGSSSASAGGTATSGAGSSGGSDTGSTSGSSGSSGTSGSSGSTSGSSGSSSSGASSD